MALSAVMMHSCDHSEFLRRHWLLGRWRHRSPADVVSTADGGRARGAWFCRDDARRGPPMRICVPFRYPARVKSAPKECPGQLGCMPTASCPLSTFSIDSTGKNLRASIHSSSCSITSAPTSRSTDRSVGRIPTTSARLARGVALWTVRGCGQPLGQPCGLTPPTTASSTATRERRGRTG